MKLIQRIGYYLVGLSLGIVLITFIFKGKKTDFSYFPDARVLKNISTKQLLYSQNALETIKNKAIDSLTISEILKSGNVNFSEGNRKLDSCKIYVIDSELNDKDVSLSVKNCETIATILSISFE